MADIHAFGLNWEIPAPLKEKLDTVVADWVAANPPTPGGPPAWEDITNKPTVFPSSPTAWADITGKPATFPASAPTWASVTGKPSTFTPATHTHTTAQVDGLDTKLSQLEAAIGSGGTGGTSAVTSVNGKTGAVQIDIPTVPVQSVDGQIGAVDLSTRYPSRGEQVISVTDHGAKGNDTVDDRSAIVAAVAAVKAVNGVLHWPAGTYYVYQGTLATQAQYSIPDFHAVRHSGPGSIRLGTTTFYPDPAQGQSNTLYVHPSGDDSNDGLHVNRPFREIRAAVAALGKYGPVLKGSWVISVGAGTYKGGVRIPPWRNPSQSEFLKIVGPTVGHPGVPTAVIDKAADTSQTYGVLSDNGALLWLEDIKVLGAFGNSVDIRQGGRIQRRNLHVEGGSIGVSLNSRVSDFSKGGIIQNCTTYGVTEMFDIVRSYDSAGAAGQGTIIRNCPIGLFSKAGSQGHLDYLEVEGCQIGVSIDRGSGNVGNLQLRKNQVAISLKDSEIHSEGGIVWGAGAEANTRRIVSYGPASSESGLWGWSSSTSPLTLRNGIRPPIQIASSYSDVTVTGTTAQAQVYNFGVILPMDRYAVQGKRLKLRAVGTLNNTLVAQLTIRMIVGGSTVGLIDLPAGTVSNTHFEFENEMICSADGNTQKNIATVRGLPAPLVKYTASTQNLTDADRSVRLDVVPYNTADSVTFRFAEVWG